MAWEPMVPEQTGISVSLAKRSYDSDWQICKYKQELSDFWAISYRFVHMFIII